MPDTPYDLLLRNGNIVDGTGGPSRRADIAVRDGRIAAIGALDGAATTEIDAEGLTVAPGFIDVHAHDDAACLNTPLDFKLLQGVTTDVIGNCGAGIAPHNPEQRIPSILSLVLGQMPDPEWRSFGEFMSTVETARPAINIACLVPHGAVRHAVLGMDNRAPTDAELDRMREYVDEGVAAGAVGMSTGLIYPPGAFAQTEEIIECAKAAAKHGAVYVSHIRNEADKLMEAVEEALRIGREGGLPVQISHHKAGAPAVWGMVRDTIALFNERRAAGEDITFDVYPYVAASTVLSAFSAEFDELDPDAVLLSSVPGHPEWEGKTLAAVSGELDLPWDQATERVLRDSPGAVAVFFLMSEEDVQTVVSDPYCMIGSDGIPTGGKPHPRLYGTFPRVLERYVREERLFSLEEGVRKMTSLPARRFALAERGELREGWHADITIFNPDTVADVATYEEPRQYPAGITHVIVNGKLAAAAGNQTEEHAGTLLRRGKA